MSLLKVAGTAASSGTLYVDDVFSTWLYTGNGSTQTINNGIDLAGKGGLVWCKPRSVGGDHYLFDTNRGANKRIVTNDTSAQFTGTTTLSAFNSDGFSLDGGATSTNGNGVSLASWTFRKAAKFFDVVTHAANTSVVINHNLGVVPACIIVKNTGNADYWGFFHRGTNGYMFLNVTDAADGLSLAGIGANTSVAWIGATSTTLDFSNWYNANTAFVVYLFAHDTSSTGIIQCGSYTGNGSATGPVVTLGWEPQYLMIKNASGIGNWQVIDSMRGMPVGSADATLQANLNNAESSVEYLSPTATGFQITSTSSEVNTSGSTYIYIAIRRPNKPPTTGTQVFGLNARTGTGANATVTGGQTDDAVLIKNRGSAVGDLFASRLTGTGYLVTSNIAAEVAAGTTILQANPWDVMDGTKVGTTSTITNASANTFINYFFKRAPGFFDEVCYTGTGANRTVTHNLGAVPEMMIVKKRNAVEDWGVYTATTGNTGSLRLNTTGILIVQSVVWNNTSPTASVFTVGTNSMVNATSDTYVAYLFATLAGISKVGSYTGNGTGQAIACGFSAGARFVLIKRTDATGDWYTFDSARGLTSGSSPYLLLNSTAAEVTGNNGVYASTGGFTLGATAITTTNIATATYIFLAVA